MFLKSGNGILPEQCKAACTAATDFYCAAAVMRAHGACYLTGYKPKGHYMGTHFYRVCKGSEHKILSDFSSRACSPELMYQ